MKGIAPFGRLGAPDELFMRQVGRTLTMADDWLRRAQRVLILRS